MIGKKFVAFSIFSFSCLCSIAVATEGDLGFTVYASDSHWQPSSTIHLKPNTTYYVKVVSGTWSNGDGVYYNEYGNSSKVLSAEDCQLPVNQRLNSMQLVALVQETTPSGVKRSLPPYSGPYKFTTSQNPTSIAFIAADYDGKYGDNSGSLTGVLLIDYCPDNNRKHCGPPETHLYSESSVANCCCQPAYRRRSWLRRHAR